jgi:hypothetical protein
MAHPDLAYAPRAGNFSLDGGRQVFTESQGRQSGQVSEGGYINLSVGFILPYALLVGAEADPLIDSWSEGIAHRLFLIPVLLHL